MFFIKLNELKYKLNDMKCDINAKIRDIETKRLVESPKNNNEINYKYYMGTGLHINIPKKILEPELEGKKSGYSKAAKEFEPIFKEIEQQYISTKEKIKKELSKLDIKSDELISILEQLESERERLEFELNNKIDLAGKGLGVSTGSIGFLGIVSIVYRKFEKAEKEGYLEAKNMYEEKINKLKAQLKKLKAKGNSEINELIELINQVNSDIAENKMKIAELKILS